MNNIKDFLRWIGAAEHELVIICAFALMVSAACFWLIFSIYSFGIGNFWTGTITLFGGPLAVLVGMYLFRERDEND
jgi:hypothetical protein